MTVDMQQFDTSLLKRLYIPPSDSHKGQNGKLLLIGGSHLFHASSLWALTVASRIVDMVFYASVPENNHIVQQAKEEFRNGIVVARDEIEDYIEEADCILIGPGMERTREMMASLQDSNLDSYIPDLEKINQIEDEGLQSYFLTKYLLQKYPMKNWVIDAGALQMLHPAWLLPLQDHVILTPHPGEFERIQSKINTQTLPLAQQVAQFAKVYKCIILLKGETDIVCEKQQGVRVFGGNAGMTKGGTGDVLAGLVAALACTNDLWLSATAGSYFNKQAGESLFRKVGYYFNASDLAEEIPIVMAQYIRSTNDPGYKKK